jgi:transposase
MFTVEERERFRRAYYLDHKSIRRIAQEEGHSREAITQAISDPTFSSPPRSRRCPVLGPYQAQIEELLTRNERLPKKQRYTAHRIFILLQADGYQGCESRVRQCVATWKRAHATPEVYLPLEFEPGQDAQVDWGEAIAVIAGVRQTVQVFVMRLCYSRRTFVMAFPAQKQECFFSGHVRAFQHFGGVPARLSYDNLATAVKLAFEKGRRRTEQHAFVALRSHYLFASHFCTPGQGHEKGQVEHSIGFARRNFLVPVPEVASFEALNQHLLDQCHKDDQRQVPHQARTIRAAWEHEQPFLRPLPVFDFDCCQTTTVRLTSSSQATFETNRYSVPVNHARQQVTVKAYPFHVDLLDRTTLLARHPRCYGRDQDIFDPLHYLPLLEQRPGAFDYAKPMRRWREGWPESYHRMLGILRERWPEGQGVQEFVRILHLHQDYDAALIQTAIEQALVYGCVHLDGVLHCLHHLTTEHDPATPLDLSDRPHLADVGNQPIDLARYERLLKLSW